MYPFMPLSAINPWIPEMRRRGVSEVARGPTGFLTAYRRVGGDPSALPDYWIQKREGFIARHMGQVNARKEKLLVNGKPTRRHLALIAWAYAPPRR